MKRIFLHSILLVGILMSLFAVSPISAVHAATLTVNTLTDENDSSCLDGDCSLRDAIELANNNDVIAFSVTGTIMLSLGEITINNSITINGPGPASLTINANDVSRIFYINTSTTVSISGLKLANGKVINSYGGAIENYGNLTLDNMAFDGNQVDSVAPLFYGFGGAIHNNNNLTVTDSAFTNNSASYQGGAIHSNFSTSTSLTNVVMTGNSASGADYPSGGAINILSDSSSQSTLTIIDSTISNNNSGYAGGGVYAQNYATITIRDTTISGNSVSGINAEEGGGIYTGTQTSLTLVNSVISGNSSIKGGAGVIAFAPAPLTIISSTISNNTINGTGDGAGVNIYTGGTSIITESTLSGNSGAESGGGVYNYSGTLTVTNSTLSGNTATTNGGGVYNFGSLTFTNNTLSGNTAPNGGGIRNDGTLNYSNTIIANSSGVDCLNSGSIGTNVNNLVEDGTCSAALSGDPLLDPLADNGGSTHTHALLTGSPAIDAGDITTCTNTPVNNLDQRRVTRPKDGNSDTVATCDVGSFEKSSIPTSATFGDVPMNHPYWLDIEILYANGLTAGCSSSPLLFCPETTMDRAQSAVFMLRGNFGNSYVPPNPPYASPFLDNWSPGTWAQKWAQGMLEEGLTAGCSTSPLLFCPWEQMPRFQAAVFGMRLQEGNAYVPPPATGTVFADITDPNLWYAKWAEAAYANGLLPACGSSGGKPLFCPNDLVSRGLGAFMIVRARDLNMP